MGAADISKSTQSIVGFYDRIVESVDANKLVLVINFGTYSPMPAIAHKKLNYYEIVTNLYKITINSNDIVIIEETGESTVDVSIVPTLQEGVKIADFAIGEVEGSIYAPEQVDVINDNVTASNTTWSSDKIDNELDKKADSSSLATVATSGSYADLTNKPTLAAVATSGSYTDLTNKPTIPADLDDLSDVTLTAPANGQTLVYDSTSEQFVNATPPSGVTTLAALSDVSLTTPVSGNSLVFDGTEWANNTLAAADIPYSSEVSVADKLDNVPTFDTITTSDNNKLLGVSVSGSDISVGAVGVESVNVSVGADVQNALCKCYRIGKIVQFFIVGEAKNSFGNSSIIATGLPIPKGTDIRYGIIKTSAGSPYVFGTTYQCAINSSGTLRPMYIPAGGIDVGNYFMISFTYLMA
jgi:hypothetical protein